MEQNANAWHECSVRGGRGHGNILPAGQHSVYKHTVWKSAQCSGDAAKRSRPVLEGGHGEWRRAMGRYSSRG